MTTFIFNAVADTQFVFLEVREMGVGRACTTCVSSISKIKLIMKLMVWSCGISNKYSELNQQQVLQANI